MKTHLIAIFLFGIYFFNGAKNLCSCMGVLRYKTCPFLV